MLIFAQAVCYMLKYSQVQRSIHHQLPLLIVTDQSVDDFCRLSYVEIQGLQACGDYSIIQEQRTSWTQSYTGSPVEHNAVKCIYLSLQTERYKACFLKENQVHYTLQYPVFRTKLIFRGS